MSWLVCPFLFCNDIAEGCLLCFNCILVFIYVSLIVCGLMFLCHGTIGWSMDVIVSYPGHAQYLAMACQCYISFKRHIDMLAMRF